MKTITKDELCAACCRAETHYKWAMTEPFVLGGYRYATDGVVCIRERLREDEPDTVLPVAANPDEQVHLPPVERLPWGEALSGESGSYGGLDAFGGLPELLPADRADLDWGREPFRHAMRVREDWINADYYAAFTLAGGRWFVPVLVPLAEEYQAVRKAVWGVGVAGEGWEAIVKCMDRNWPGAGDLPELPPAEKFRALLRARVGQGGA